MKVETPESFGVHVNGSATEFSLFSAYAESVRLCLFEEKDAAFQLADSYELQADDRGRWSIVLENIAQGTAYGYRVSGPFEPTQGHWFNAQKLLFDPYARAVARVGSYSDAMCSSIKDEKMSRVPNLEDSMPFTPLAAVAGRPEPLVTTRPNHTSHSLLLYETHLKGMTQLHPEVPPSQRGTYLGMSHPAVLAHLQQLGVTAVEFLPLQFHFDEPHLQAQSMVNYWGYNTLGYFAPDPRYAHGGGPLDAISEFRQMVVALHQAGIEVILDVVYNHTAEAGVDGPTLCWRGIDNANYYRLDERDRSKYVDYTGCGNSLDTRHPIALQMVLESLRYWVECMGVDGFRFDLAPVLGRGRFDMDPQHGFFKVLRQDPVLRSCKLLAEPWDLGTYQLGHFPKPWIEWNGQFRDVTRDYWRGEPRMAARFATRLAGSSDLFASRGRSTHAGVNFVVCHDGFSLRDLVSYNRKHNEANLEGNRDGSSDNRSWNCGVEGETTDPAVLRVRLQQQKNLLLTVFLAAGIPMIHAGDEFSASKSGNNNTYCQDNELSWLSWGVQDEGPLLVSFLQDLHQFREENPTLRRSEFFTGEASSGAFADVSWWSTDGTVLEPQSWEEKEISAFAALYGKSDVPIFDGLHQQRLLYVCFNPDTDACDFLLPEELAKLAWTQRLSTADQSGFQAQERLISVAAHSALVLQAA